MKNMLMKVGWKKDYVEKCVPVLPISGWIGDNLIKKTENMSWWKGVDVIDYGMKGDKFHIDTLSTSSAAWSTSPSASPTPTCASPSPAFTRSRASVTSSRGVEQGGVRPGEDVVFILRNTPPTPARARCSPSRCTTSASRRLTR